MNNRSKAKSLKAAYEHEMVGLLNEIPGLEQMTAEFQIKSRAAQWYVLNGEDPDLDGLTPVHCLRRIMQIIRGYGKQGAS